MADDDGDAPPIDAWRQRMKPAEDEPASPSTRSVLEQLSTMDGELSQLWSYLRSTAMVSRVTLQKIENYLEACFLRTRAILHTDVVEGPDVATFCTNLQESLDSAKLQFRVLRRVTERMSTRTKVDVGLAAQVGADEEEVATRLRVAIRAIDDARDKTHDLYNPIAVEAKAHGTGKTPVAPQRRPRQHHQAFRRYSA
jgi:hypothetical protein